MALCAFARLALGLGQVRIDRRPVGVRQFRDLLQEFLRASVLGVETQMRRNERMMFPVLEMISLDLLRRQDKVVEPVEDHGPVSGIGRGLRDHLRIEIHIEIGGDTARQIFHDRELREPEDMLRCQLRLHGKDPFGQPFLQRQIIRVGAQERHRRMGVRVLEPRHDEMAFRVDLPVPDGDVLRGRAGCLAGIGYCIILNPYFPADDIRRAVHGQDPRVVYACIHESAPASDWSNGG